MNCKEIKDLLNEINGENIKELKPAIIRMVNELVLNISDDSISDSELEKLCNFYIMREEIRKEISSEEGMNEGLIIEEFIKSCDEFIGVMEKNGYTPDAIELINLSLRSIGGIARGYRLVKKYAGMDNSNDKYLKELKDEFYKQLRSYGVKGIYEEQFVICGLINVIKFELEEKSQEHGRSVISMLTDYKTKKIKNIEEFEGEEHLEELKAKVKEEYGIELQRRIYLWNKLTMKLQDHYYLEALYEEAD